MKRGYIFLLVIIVIIGILFFNSSSVNYSKIKNVDSDGKNLICFGNSITAGTGTKKEYSYPSLLKKKLSIPVINAGVSGDTTAQALKRIEEDVLQRNPQIVIIELGGNDFLGNVPEEETINNLSKIVTKVQKAGAIAVLVEIKTGFFKNKYGDDLRRIAEDKKALLIPNILEGILSNPELKSDRIHPNKKGYKMIAERILKKIKPLLEYNRAH